MLYVSYYVFLVLFSTVILNFSFLTVDVEKFKVKVKVKTN